MQLKNRLAWLNAKLQYQPHEPIFEKRSHLRDKDEVLTLRTPIGVVLTHPDISMDISRISSS
jgi:hypothetical protein